MREPRDKEPANAEKDRVSRNMGVMPTRRDATPEGQVCIVMRQARARAMGKPEGRLQLASQY